LHSKNRIESGRVAAYAEPCAKAPGDVALTELQEFLIRGGFEKSAPGATAIAANFYARLFERNPAMRLRLVGALAAQAGQLVAMLEIALADVYRLNVLFPPTVRSSHYDARDQHMASVGADALWRLREAFGDALAPAMLEAWTGAYRELASAMREGADGVAAP
jgi:hemoglobin-like flavoprotein